MSAASDDDRMDTVRREPSSAGAEPASPDAASADADGAGGGDATSGDADATARRERPDDDEEVDELELLGRLTAERQRQGSLDD